MCKNRKEGINIKGGYTGYYNGKLLRSSYEYIFAKYLESINKHYEVEYQTFDLGDYTYTPDFFLFDNKSNLEEIIEIRGYRLNLKERIIDTKKLKQIVNVKVTLLTELDLIRICNENNLNYNNLMNEWINNPDTVLNDNRGKCNSMFGKHHSNKTKQIISEKAKNRMADEEYKNKIVNNMVQYCKETNYADAKKPRSKRIILQCKHCGKDITVTEALNYKKYCSLECFLASKENIKNLKQMKERNIEITNHKYFKIKLYVENWAKMNKQTIIRTKLNNIIPSLKSLLEEIENEFNIKDIRTISMAVCKTQSRKEFIKYLKSII